MQQFAARVTTKGQVTIPVEIRRLLGINPYDRVAFVIEDGQVQLTRTGSVIEQTKGAAAGRGPRIDVSGMRDLAERAIAEETVERMGR
jgi:AbrB family looped-hinge helix DNA binding protein